MSSIPDPLSMDVSWNFSLSGNTTLDHSRPLSVFEIHILVPVTVACILLFFLGVGGNLSTLLVFWRTQSLHTTTNLYLSSMAISDILIFSGLPLDLYRLWRYRPFPFGDFLCRFQFYLSESCTYATILHITALSVERYLAICFPLHARRLVSRARVQLVIVALWGLAGTTAVPVFFLFHVAGQECQPTEAGLRSGLLQAMTWVSTLYFFLPLACLCLLYGLICRRLGHMRHRPYARIRQRHQRQTVRLLVVVVLSFALCWLPFHIGRILFSTAVWDDEDQGGREALYTTSQNFNLAAMLLFYLSASINPVLYNLLSARYRLALRGMLQSQRPRSRLPQRHRSSHHIRVTAPTDMNFCTSV
ncbi:growth hormone secretagogue receptor type 1-like isoform X1 [Brienomyrus brachyistius]|uniref:growth hormone secretagogue receptor type 1-like isoform X1 n=1 Tax=Brienomyrus brachyistius TaxID=42636 RepID=UPI0020B440C0|nr:growth hormone secretagogue receptor type 1-like isoform X1 [Brienomyrus brachyistius]